VCVVHAASVFAFEKIIARRSLRLPPPSESAFYLLPTPPLRRFDHVANRDAPGTNPAAVVVPALVRIFAQRVPWVSWFPSMANTFLGAAARPSYLTQPIVLIGQSWLRFQGTNLEDPLTAKRLLVPSAIVLSDPGTSFGIDPLKAYRQAISRLSWLSYSRSKTYFDTRGCHSPARSIAGLAAPHAGQR
jgi:hypothetical protein